jgi:hypothetical protein
LEDTISVLLKHEADLQKAKRQLINPPPQQPKPRDPMSSGNFLEIKHRDFSEGAKIARPVFKSFSWRTSRA